VSLSGFILLLGIFLLLHDPEFDLAFDSPPLTHLGVQRLFIVSGVFGLGLGWLFHGLYRHRMSTLDGAKGWWLMNWVEGRWKRGKKIR